MKISKKLTIAGITISLIFGATFIYSILPQKIHIQTVSAAVIYNYGDKSIQEALSNEEALTIYNVFNGKTLVAQSSTFLFTNDVSIRFGDQTFCVACDGSTVIKLQNKNMYFNITPAERQIINGVFEKYGGEFPCV
jgi:hypothetical protein